MNKDIASSSSTNHEPMKSDYCLCLAIHAPRKGIIEVCLLLYNISKVHVSISTYFKKLLKAFTEIVQSVSSLVTVLV